MEGEEELGWERKGGRSMPTSGQDQQGHVFLENSEAVAQSSWNITDCIRCLWKSRYGFGNDSEGVVLH